MRQCFQPKNDSGNLSTLNFNQDLHRVCLSCGMLYLRVLGDGSATKALMGQHWFALTCTSHE